METWRDRLTALSVRQQILLALGLCLVSCVLIGGTWFAFIRVPDSVLFSGLRPGDAATIVADLDRKRISYSLADGGATILVPANLADRTRLSVMTEDIPLKGTVGFELFDKSDMGLTDFAQKINFQRALQGELERTIASLDGVDTARVHLSLGEDRIFRDDQVPPKASVTVRMQHGAILSAEAAQGIQRLVSAAVPNLDTANVVILDEHGKLVDSGAQASDDQASQPSAADEEKRAIEQYYEAKVRLALEHAYPLSAFAVAVSAAISAGAPGNGANQEWNPASRTFPLNVDIASPKPVEPSVQDAVQAAAASAIGFDLAKNDVVRVMISAPAPTPPAPIVHRRPVMGPQLVVNDSEQPVATVIVFALLVMAAVVILWLLLRRHRLSKAQAVRMADRFRILLEQEDGSAAS